MAQTRLEEFNELIKLYPQYLPFKKNLVFRNYCEASDFKVKPKNDHKILYIYKAIHIDSGKEFFLSQTRIKNDKSERMVGLSLKANETLIYSYGESNELLDDLELIIGNAYLVIPLAFSPIPPKPKLNKKKTDLKRSIDRSSKIDYKDSLL